MGGELLTEARIDYVIGSVNKRRQSDSNEIPPLTEEVKEAEAAQAKKQSFVDKLASMTSLIFK